MTDSPHVVIVGAGFAGLSAVGRLRKAGLRVTVIDKNLYSTFQPLLYQVATGGLNPGDVAYPVGGFTSRRDARYIRGELAAIDRAARRVRLADGREIGYDYLILATGVSANYFGMQGAAENTFGLYTRADAIVLRDHIMNGFEWLSGDRRRPPGVRDHRGRRRRDRGRARGHRWASSHTTCCAPPSPTWTPPGCTSGSWRWHRNC